MNNNATRSEYPFLLLFPISFTLFYDTFIRSGVLGAILNEKALAITVAITMLASLALVAASTMTLLAPVNAALTLDRVFEKEDKDGDIVTKEKRTESNEHSSDAAEVTIDRDLSVGEDENDDPANTWERTIDKPGDDIVISGESDEHSSRTNGVGGVTLVDVSNPSNRR